MGLAPLVTCGQTPAPWVYNEQRHQTLPTDDSWWNSFNDSTLNSLISTAVDNNLDVLMAYKRIRLAKLALAQTRSAYFPTIGVSASWAKEQATHLERDDYFDLALSMNWQIDVFGRINAQSKAKKAAWRASAADYAATMVTLCANLADAYVNLRSYQAQLQVANEHLKSQAEILNITQVRFDCGLASDLDVQQAKTVYSSTEASIPQLEVSIHTLLNSIALYLNEDPAKVFTRLSTPQPMPSHVQLIQDSIPLELIRRRPDVVAAEQSLAEAAAEVGIAKKDFLPTLSLSASIGTRSSRFDDLFGDGSMTYSVMPTLSWTIFSGLSRKYAVDSAKENMQIAIDNYNLILRQSINEADNAQFSYIENLARINSLSDAAKAAHESLILSIDLYKRGLSDFSNVMDAQQSYLNYSNEVISAQAESISCLINLYQALGGGWTPDF